jgi:putative peptidoglycan lipid II flippase
MTALAGASPDGSAGPAGGTRLASAAGVIALATVASRVLGLVRDQVFAFFFGAGNDMDAFLIAFRIPNLLRDLFAEGAMSAAFVPAFTRQVMLNGKDRAWRFGNNVITALLAVTLPLALLGMLFAGPIVRMYAHDYGQIPGKIELTIRLTRVMMPFLTLVALAAAMMGMLNAMHRFFMPALSPAMFNVATILCAVTLVPLMPAAGLPAVMAVAIGTIAGGIGQIAVQWPSLRREGFRYRPVLDVRDGDLRELGALMVPSVVGLGAVQVNLFVNSILATGEGTGAVSWLNYAFRLMYLPIGLFGVSIATAAIPEISRHAAREDLAGMRGAITRALRLMSMLTVPATLGLAVLAGPIVALIFERGSFAAADTRATSAALVCYAPGLIGYAVVKLASPSFYALRDSRTPAVVGVLSMVLNVVLNLVLVRLMGYRGLAIGTALAALFNGGVLLWLLSGRLGGLEGRRTAIVFTKIVVASIAMAASAWGIEHALRLVEWGSRTAARALQVGSAIGVGLLVLGASAHLLRIDEFREARELALTAVRRTRSRHTA